MIYWQLNTYLGKKEGRPWTSRNLRVVRLSPYEIGIRHWDTIILRYHSDGSVQLNNGGWYSVTTKKHMNKGLSEYSAYVLQRKGQWFLIRNGIMVPYQNHTTLSA